MLRGFAPSGAGRHRGALRREAQAPHGVAARRAVARQGYRPSARSWITVQLERIRSLVERRARARAARSISQVEHDGCPPRRLLFSRRRSSPTCAPASTLAQEEIFGPVLVTMSFRTPDEAVALANNSRYGLAASVWSETISRALDVAPRLQCGVVWINATNLFDAAVGFGGYRESGFGREGGREGIYEYLKPRAWTQASGSPRRPPRATQLNGVSGCTRGQRTARTSYPSTARRSSLSAASRRARTAATRCSMRSPVGHDRSAKWARATARTSATRSQRRARAQKWSRREHAQPRAGAVLPRRESVGARRRIRASARRASMA